MQFQFNKLVDACNISHIRNIAFSIRCSGRSWISHWVGIKVGGAGVQTSDAGSFRRKRMLK